MLIGFTAYVFLMPIVIGAVVGLWSGWRSDIDGAAGLFRALGWAALVAFTLVYAVQMLWIAAIVNEVRAIDSVALWAGKWTLFTGLIWLPTMVISFLGAALVQRRRA